jgi:hypothetical protein
VARMGDRRGAYRVLVARPVEKRPLRKPGRRWKNNTKMNLQRSGVGSHGLDCCGSVEGLVDGACECGNEHSGSIKCGEFLDQLRNC